MPPKKVKGGKAKKGKAGSKANRGDGNRRNNPRAFLAAAGPKAMRNKAYRALEKQEKQYHVTLVDRSAEANVPPPYIVVVVGPAGVGKSTLIQSLVKQWTKQNLGAVLGPVTVVTGKKRRLTIVECPNDMNAMCDLSKVADLVLLLVDGSFGFQMETFEFLNMCQVRAPKKARRTPWARCAACAARCRRRRRRCRQRRPPAAASLLPPPLPLPLLLPLSLLMPLPARREETELSRAASQGTAAPNSIDYNSLIASGRLLLP